MNDLEKFFFQKEHWLMHKWNHYFEIYDRHFSKYRGKEIHLLEIGISHGGSLQMWQDYFGDKVHIYAVDINPECKKLETERIKVFIGSQEDRSFLRKLRSEIPTLDILIDDGGHSMKQQIFTFEELYTHVKEEGIYLCEDIHTSYWKPYGGGYRKKRSFIEYTKNFIDSLHIFHSSKIKKDLIAGTAFSLHYYDSVVVVEKRKLDPPFDVKSGNNSIADQFADMLLRKK